MSPSGASLGISRLPNYHSRPRLLIIVSDQLVSSRSALETHDLTLSGAESPLFHRGSPESTRAASDESPFYFTLAIHLMAILTVVSALQFTGVACLMNHVILFLGPLEMKDRPQRRTESSAVSEGNSARERDARRRPPGGTLTNSPLVTFGLSRRRKGERDDDDVILPRRVSAKLCPDPLVETRGRGLFIILHYSVDRKHRYCTDIEKAQKGDGDAKLLHSRAVVKLHFPPAAADIVAYCAARGDPSPISQS